MKKMKTIIMHSIERYYENNSMKDKNKNKSNNYIVKKKYELE